MILPPLPNFQLAINHRRRYHESLNNLSPEDVWLGNRETSLAERKRIKENTLRKRKELYWQKIAA